MKELRETLVKNIIQAKTDEEIEHLVLEAISLLRKHMVNEFDRKWSRGRVVR